MVTLGRVLLGAVQAAFPTTRTYHLLPFVLVGTFVLLALLPRGSTAWGIIGFGAAGPGCSALLPLTISFGEEQLVAMSSLVAGAIIAFYQVGYGIAAFGAGPLQSAGVSLSTIFGFTAVLALAMGGLSFVLARPHHRVSDLHPRRRFACGPVRADVHVACSSHRLRAVARKGTAVNANSRHRVVVVGGGFGGLPAARVLSGADVDVTLIDQRNHHLFQPLLYQVATGILSPGEIAPVLRHLLRRHENVQVALAKVTGFDLEARLVHTSSIPGESFDYPYDSLIVAAGAGQSYFGHDEYALIAPGMKTIDDAMELRRRVYGALEIAETRTDPTQQRFFMTFAIVGAGPTGVELAGQIRELAARSLAHDFRHIDPAAVRVILIDGGTHPLATFGGSLSERAAKALEKMGVELCMGQRVVGVDALGVDTEGSDGAKGRFECGTTIWAAGVQASPLAGMLAEATGASTDRAGRIAVLPDLTLPGHPEVFAVGDMATLNNLPGVCEVALQGGLHAANTVKRRLAGKESVAFKYRDLGSAAAIGRFKAVVSVRGLHLSGFPGWVVWLFVHVAFLNGFGNRLRALWRWSRSMLGRARPERVFSVGHTGGDLSLPDEVKAKVMPRAFPVVESDLRLIERVGRRDEPRPATAPEGTGKGLP